MTSAFIRMYMGQTRNIGICLAIAFSLVASTASTSLADSNKPPRKPKSAFSMFADRLNTRDIFEVVEIKPAESEKPNFVAAVPPPPPPKTEQQKLEESLDYYGEDPTQDPIKAPNEETKVRVAPDAPSSIRGMIAADRMGKRQLAENYADQFVKMQKEYFFEIRRITSLIGQALIRQNVITDDSWIGAEQHMEIEMARTREEMQALLRPDHDTALQQIEPDSKGKAHVFYFFSLQCSWCRYMAPDVERMWRIAKDDPHVSMNILSIGKAPTGWVDEYRKYTGLTAPIEDGTELAKQFKVGFVPAVLIIAPSDNKAYLKTGQQSFVRMYQFMRRVQGMPATITKQLEVLAQTPIGHEEHKHFAKHRPEIAKASAGTRVPVKTPKKMELATF